MVRQSQVLAHVDLQLFACYCTAPGVGKISQLADILQQVLHHSDNAEYQAFSDLLALQACPEGRGRDTHFSSVCCHSCKLQILPGKQVNQGSKGQIAAGHITFERLDPALMPPYIHQQAKRNTVAALKTGSDLATECSALRSGTHDAANARDHMRAYLAAYLLPVD